MSFNAIELEILWKRLISVVDEAAAAFVRTCFSTLVRGPAMTCLSLGNGGGDRTAAWCVSPRGGDLSCSMVATGTVLRWDRYWGNHRC